MNRSKFLGFAIGAWIVVEILAFTLVIKSLGVLATVALGLGTTALGLADVKRLLSYWRERRSGASRGGATLDGAMQALGALLLILPGFASDFVGLALKSPSVRESVARRIRERGKAKDPRTIDLEPGEWKVVTKKRRAPRKAGAK
ncbi:FxsA family protein [Methylocystis sp. WRRC1]|uniref:FxsA family protein n=1 Tax=Methylocystis sp. WRRC1 TaxID=1732014 RepID=UPI001D156C4E|nr:FxsA family protein [Methylocystis sp. WRRC1]